MSNKLSGYTVKGPLLKVKNALFIPLATQDKFVTVLNVLYPPIFFS